MDLTSRSALTGNEETPNRLGLLEEAQRQALGQYLDNTQWNKVYVSKNDYFTVERANRPRGEHFGPEHIKYTLATERTPRKDQCGLCRMYFKKNSLKYRVANHRIIDLQKIWHFSRQGRRYESASFLYEMTNVCIFCSQLFSDIDLERTTVQTQASLADDSSSTSEKYSLTSHKVRAFNPIESPRILKPRTPMHRRDLAEGNRAYQSSVVDGLDASFAVTPPYTKHSRTRREADPWWEVDLGRPYPIHRITFFIQPSAKQMMSIHVMLLRHPVGFENPFLEHVETRAVESKEFLIDGAKYKIGKEVVWDIAKTGANTTCAAIRVQLKGINVLAIGKFQALQGNNVITCSTDDLNMTSNSFASLAPSTIKEGVAAMMTPSMKRQMTREKMRTIEAEDPRANNKKFNERMKTASRDVTGLAFKIRSRYDALDSWKSTVSQFVKYFLHDELIILYRVLFLNVVEASQKKTQQSSQLLTRRKDVFASIPDHELFEAGGLTTNFPRADLSELHHRLKSLLRSIQSRHHGKLLGPLTYSERFVGLANDPAEPLNLLANEFKKIEAHIQAAAKELAPPPANPLFRPQTRDQFSTTVNKSDIYLEEHMGCSWAQFIIIMSLFCCRQIERIPALAYGIGDDPGGGDIEEADVNSQPQQGGEHLGDDGKVGGSRLNTAQHDDLRRPSNALGLALSPLLRSMSSRIVTAGGGGGGAGGGAVHFSSSRKNSGRDGIGGGSASSRPESAAAAQDLATVRTGRTRGNSTTALALAGGSKTTPHNHNLIPATASGDVSRSGSIHDLPALLLAANGRSRSQSRSMVSGGGRLSHGGLSPSPPLESSISSVELQQHQHHQSSDQQQQQATSGAASAASPPTKGKISFNIPVKSSKEDTRRDPNRLYESIHVVTSPTKSEPPSLAATTGSLPDKNQLLKYSHSMEKLHSLERRVARELNFPKKLTPDFVPSELLDRANARAASRHDKRRLKALRNGDILGDGDSSGGENDTIATAAIAMAMAKTTTDTEDMGGAATQRSAPLASVAASTGRPGGLSKAARGLPAATLTTGRAAGGQTLAATSGSAAAAGVLSARTRGGRSTDTRKQEEEEEDDDDDSEFYSDDDDDFGGGGRRRRRKKKGGKNDGTLGFWRTCAMCERKYPRDAMEVKVLWKHIINLRRSWDRSLVPREIEALDKTISMYNLFPVCLFCAQFFDPDFPGGIAYPVREQATQKKTGIIAAINAQRDRDGEEISVMRPCYDDRHTLRGGPEDRAGTFWKNSSTQEARRRARRAVKLEKDPRSGYSGTLDVDPNDSSREHDEQWQKQYDDNDEVEEVEVEVEGEVVAGGRMSFANAYEEEDRYNNHSSFRDSFQLRLSMTSNNSNRLSSPTPFYEGGDNDSASGSGGSPVLKSLSPPTKSSHSKSVNF